MWLYILVQDFAQYRPHHPKSCQGQGHRLRIFMLKFYVKDFRTSLFFYLTGKHEFRRVVLSGNRSSCCIAVVFVSVYVCLICSVSVLSEPAHNKTYNKTCDQERLRSACTSAQSGQNLCWSHEPFTASGLSKEAWRKIFAFIGWCTAWYKCLLVTQILL